MNKFDRIGDWQKFSKRMEEYIETPQKKYGSELKFNDLCHYTGLRVMLWNILKYALRLWSSCGKEHDFEKIAHYAQMGFCFKERQGRIAPFFKEDVEGDYVVSDIEISKQYLKELNEDRHTFDIKYKNIREEEQEDVIIKGGLDMPSGGY